MASKLIDAVVVVAVTFLCLLAFVALIMGPVIAAAIVALARQGG